MKFILGVNEKGLRAKSYWSYTMGATRKED